MQLDTATSPGRRQRALSLLACRAKAAAVIRACYRAITPARARMLHRCGLRSFAAGTRTLVTETETSQTTRSHAARSRSGASESAPQKVEQAASGMADAARRASGPLTLGAGVLGGLATGVAIGLKFRNKPRFSGTGKALGELAGVAGEATKQLARVAADVEKVREQVGDSGGRASPIEVLLQGLTHRRR